MDLDTHPDVDGLRDDLRHLADLWSMLPSRRDEEFWQELAASVAGDDSGQIDYFLENIDAIGVRVPKMVDAVDVTLFNVQHIVQYVLLLFDVDNPKTFELLDRTVNYRSAYEGTAGRTGRRWAEDATATAWRLYVAGWSDAQRNGF